MLANFFLKARRPCPSNIGEFALQKQSRFTHSANWGKLARSSTISLNCILTDMTKLSLFWNSVKQAALDFNDDNGFKLSASLSYSTIFAMGPLLIVVKKPNVELTRDELIGFFEGRIAKWWTPDDVIFVDAIPLGATGKMLKNRLREQYGKHLMNAG